MTYERIGQFDCGNYFITYEITTGDTIVKIINGAMNRSATVSINNEQIRRMFMNNDPDFAVLHFMAWLGGSMPEDIANNAGFNSRSMKLLRTSLLKQLNSQGIYVNNIDEITLFLLNV